MIRNQVASITHGCIQARPYRSKHPILQDIMLDVLIDVLIIMLKKSVASLTGGRAEGFSKSLYLTVD